MKIATLSALTLLACLAGPATAQVESDVITVTLNGAPPNPGDFIEFFLVQNAHPCAPTSTNCVDDDVAGSGLIDCGNLDAAGMAQAIVNGLNGNPALPPGVTVTQLGDRFRIDNDTSISGQSFFLCINMIECPAPFGYGLGGPAGCAVNNVCSGVCGDEDDPPGATGFNFQVGGVETETVKITQTGVPSSPGDVIEFFLVNSPAPCAPTSTNCAADQVAGSGLIVCDGLDARGLAQAIAAGLSANPALPPGITVSAVGDVLTVSNDTTVSGQSVSLCVNMSECMFPFGYGLGGSDGCVINNVCSGACGDEASAPGPTGFHFAPVEPLGESYCVGAANSVGAGAAIGAVGSASVADQNLCLIGSGLPNTPSLFFYGPLQIQSAFGDGFRCVGGATTRIQPPQVAVGNVATKTIDFSVASAAGIVTAAMGGQALDFQLWYRDPMGPGGSGFNLTDGVEIVFEP